MTAGDGGSAGDDASTDAGGDAGDDIPADAADNDVDPNRGLGRAVRDPRRRLRSVARIARWEVSHSVGTVDRRTALLGVLAVVVALGVAGGSAMAGGVALDSDLYRVAVAEDSPYHDPVAAAPSLDPVSPEADWDVRIVDRDVGDRRAHFVARNMASGQAALSALRDAVAAANDRLMLRQENESAAFPVSVTLRYATRADASSGTVGGDAGGEGGNTDAGGGGGDAAGGDAGGGGDDPGGATGGDDGRLAVPDVGGSLFADSQSGSPADIRPPFPFASLVLAFAFLVPLNFVTQAYGSTILDERIDRRGELLLVAPVEPGDVVAGKTLPYVLGAVASTVLVALVVGGGALSVAAVLPVALLYLAGTFVAGMFARSFKELTFVTVTLSVFLTTYTFVPAIFTNVTPVALISPLTLVVRDLQGAAVSPGEYLFSTGPFYVAAGVLFLLGLGVYREEDMFTQRPVHLKFLDALVARIAGRRSMATLSALFVPFVFVAELLAVAVLFALPLELSLPVLLVTIAGVEEVAKSVHVYAGLAADRFAATLPAAVLLGSLSGLGFFVGEKLTVVVQLVGLPQVTLGRLAFATGGTAGLSGTTAVALLLAPLALHAVTASVSAAGATRGRRAYLGALGVATLLHAGYNVTVVSVLA